MKKKIKSIYILPLIALALVVYVIRTSYAMSDSYDAGMVNAKSGIIKVDLVSGNSISISGIDKEFDDDKHNIVSQINVKNNGNLHAYHNLSINLNSDTIKEEDIRYCIGNNNICNLSGIKLLSDNKYIKYHSLLEVGKEEEYEVYLWLDYDSGVDNGNGSINLTIESTNSKIYAYDSIKNLFKNSFYNTGNINYSKKIGKGFYNELIDDTESIDSNYYFVSSNLKDYYNYQKDIKNRDFNEYYDGILDNNYVWFNCKNGMNSGKNYCELWRVIRTVDLDNNKGIMIIKDSPNNDTIPYYLDNYSIDESNSYKDSNLRKYLNKDYYNNLDNDTRKLIVKYPYKYVNNLENNDFSYVLDYVSVPSMYEFMITNYDMSVDYDKSYYNNPFYSWITGDYHYMEKPNIGAELKAGYNVNYALTRDSYNYYYSYIDKNGISPVNEEIAKNAYLEPNSTLSNSYYDSYYYQPIVVLRSDIIFDTGMGTKDNPYSIKLLKNIDIKKTSLKLNNNSIVGAICSKNCNSKNEIVKIGPDYRYIQNNNEFEYEFSIISNNGKKAILESVDSYYILDNIKEDIIDHSHIKINDIRLDNSKIIIDIDSSELIENY